MARRASGWSRRHVRADKSETRGAVIEFSVGPRGDRVTGRAGSCRCREARGDVIWYVAAESRRALPCGLMAAHAIC